MCGLGLALILVLGLFQPALAVEEEPRDESCKVDLDDSYAIFNSLVEWRDKLIVTSSSRNATDAYYSSDIENLGILLSMQLLRFENQMEGYNQYCPESYGQKCAALMLEVTRDSAINLLRAIGADLEYLHGIQNQIQDDVAKHYAAALIKKQEKAIGIIKRVHSIDDASDMGLMPAIGAVANEPVDIKKLKSFKSQLASTHNKLEDFLESDVWKKDLSRLERIFAYDAKYLFTIMSADIDTLYEYLAYFNLACERKLLWPCKASLQVDAELFAKHLISVASQYMEHISFVHKRTKNKELRNLFYELYREHLIFQENMEQYLEYFSKIRD